MSDPFAKVMRKAEDFQFAYGHFFDKAIVVEQLRHALRKPRNTWRGTRSRSLSAIFCAAYRSYHGKGSGNLTMRRRVRTDVGEYKTTGVLPLYVIGAYWHADMSVRQEIVP